MATGGNCPATVAPDARGFDLPHHIAVDRAFNLYVVDRDNNRVLAFAGPVQTNQAASLVFGQASFTSATANANGLSADSLNQPHGVAVDATGNLYLADSSNHRLLAYDTPLVPKITGLSPNSSPVSSAGFRLTVDGPFFLPGSLVRWNSTNLTPTSATPTRLVVDVPPGFVATAGTATITVVNPNPSVGPANVVGFPIGSPPAPNPGDLVPDQVIGQPNFASFIANNGGSSATSLNGPRGLAVDRRNGRLYVADTDNNRVLSWPSVAAYVTGQPADRVIGQPDFTTVTPNTGGLSGKSLNHPAGVAVDGKGRLYIADTGNNRVLRFTLPPTTGTQPPSTALHGTADEEFAADAVFGQPDYFSSAPDSGGVSQFSLEQPQSVAADLYGNVYVADTGNNRVLGYSGETIDRTPTNPGAGLVLGQLNFGSDSANAGGLGVGSLWGPGGVATDVHGDVYVADTNNNRVLRYENPQRPGADTLADGVIGQVNYTSNRPNWNGVSADGLSYPRGVAVDDSGHVYVADSGNHRALAYDNPRFYDTHADYVFGQPDFQTNTVNYYGFAAQSYRAPAGVFVDPITGWLMIADPENHRVSVYSRPIPPGQRQGYLPLAPKGSIGG